MFNYNFYIYSYSYDSEEEHSDNEDQSCYLPGRKLRSSKSISELCDTLNSNSSLSPRYNNILNFNH